MTAKVEELVGRVGIDYPHFFAAHAVGESAADLTLQVAWNAFPRRLRLRGLDRAAVLEAAEERRSTAGGFLDDAMMRPRRFRHRAQDEYVEWGAVSRGGAIERFVFTVEPPEYWRTLFETDGARALALYREIVGRDVELSELTFDRDVWDSQEGGRPVLRHRRGEYDPHNRVNVEEMPVHLTHPDNSLDAEIDLVARATVQRVGADGRRISDRRHLACCSDFGDPNRHSDPTIGATINHLVHGGLSVTLANPVGIQLGGFDESRVRGPQGEPLTGWWRVTRGAAGRAVRAEFGPPPGSRLTCREVLVKGVPLTRGGQLAELITALVQVRAVRRSLPRAPTRRCANACFTDRGADPTGNLRQQQAGRVPPSGTVDPFATQAAPAEPVLDGDDIQGHVLAGFGRVDLRVVALHARTSRALRAALRTVSPHVTSLSGALRDRAARKDALTAGRDLPAAFHVAVSLTRPALDLLGVDVPTALDEAFHVGMDPSRTGDPTARTERDGSLNEAAREQWVIGGPQSPLHLLVLIGSTRDDRAAEALLEALRAIPDVSLPYLERGTHLGDREHFGFVDGVAQVGVLGEVTVDGQRVPVTTRHGVAPHGANVYGRPGQALAWPGRFLVGAPRWEGDAGERDLRTFRNGSLLVFRRLRQDVRAFREDTDALARDVGVSGDHLRGLVVGRHQSGQPLTANSVPHPLGMDYFRYVEPTATVEVDGATIQGAPADVLGAVCPHWSHIRKVNPRDSPTDLGDETTHSQVLRRGVPFGPPFEEAPEAARGLLFFAYQRSISGQFEVLNADWMNRYEAPFGRGVDLLVGQRVREGRYAERSVFWAQRDRAVPRHWVWPTGGAYLFAPSRSAIAAWAREPT